MKRFFTKRVRIIVAVLAAVLFAPLVIQAAAPNFPAIGSAVWPMTFHLSGQYTATATNIVKFNAPFNMRLLYANASARAKGGSNVVTAAPTSATNVELKNAGTSMTTGGLGMDLGNPAAAVVVEASLVAAQQNIARDSAVTADLVVLGNSPTINDITVTLWFQRRP